MEQLRPGPARDAGGVVVGWLTKVTVVAAVAGLVTFDALSIGAARMSVEDAGALAAREASADYRRTGSVQLAYNAAAAAAYDANPLNVVPTQTFEPLSDGRVRLTVTRKAPTLVVHRIGWIEHWADVRADATGLPVP